MTSLVQMARLCLTFFPCSETGLVLAGENLSLIPACKADRKSAVSLMSLLETNMSRSRWRLGTRLLPNMFVACQLSEVGVC